MKIALGRMVLLIKDFDKAFSFYEENLGCIKIYDSINEKGKRFLHIGFSSKSNVGLWFLKAETEEQLKLVGNQTGGMPAFVLYTDNLEEAYDRLSRNKVQIVKKPIVENDFSFLHFLDLYGNEIVLVEMK